MDVEPKFDPKSDRRLVGDLGIRVPLRAQYHDPPVPAAALLVLTVFMWLMFAAFVWCVWHVLAGVVALIAWVLP